eukprot:12436757-Alexandrium_andersonii.AAC.1
MARRAALVGFGGLLAPSPARARTALGGVRGRRLRAASAGNGRVAAGAAESGTRTASAQTPLPS